MISLFNYLDQNKEDLKYNNPNSLLGNAWGMTREALNLQSDSASEVMNGLLDGASNLFNIDTETTPMRPEITTDKTDLNLTERYYLGLLNAGQNVEDIVSNLPSSGARSTGVRASVLTIDSPAPAIAAPPVMLAAISAGKS